MLSCAMKKEAANEAVSSEDIRGLKISGSEKLSESPFEKKCEKKIEKLPKSSRVIGRSGVVDNKLPKPKWETRKKPIVLSLQRYEKIKANATQAEKIRIQKEIEEEQKHKKYLKEGGERLVASFTGNIMRTQDQKLEEIKQTMELKAKQAKQSIDKIMKFDEQLRQERLAEAQYLVDSLKPGPRQVRSAALQSEVLRCRNAQCKINEQFQRAVRKQECVGMDECNLQNMPWMVAEKRQSEAEERAKALNHDFKKDMEERNRARCEQKRKLLEEQLAEREAIDADVKAQIEKERALMEKKKEAMRKNAIEAMKMVEQRRLRDRMIDEAEDSINCVYLSGKRHLDQLRAEQEKRVSEERQKMVERNVEVATAMQKPPQNLEPDQVRRDISHMQLIFTAEEREKVLKDRAAKKLRIEAYQREMEQQKLAKMHAEEQKRFDMAQRFKNDEMNCLFNEAQQEEKQRKVKELRDQLAYQIEERKKMEEEAKKVKHECTTLGSYEKQDKFFFEYARKLAEDAHQKQRPMYPFSKVIHQYKRDNALDYKRRVPKHLVSNITVGVRQPDDTTATAVPIYENENRRSIYNNISKIDELLAQQRGKAAPCEQICPFDCTKATGAVGGALARRQYEGDCYHSTVKENMIRYSVGELKELNQYKNYRIL